MKLASKPSLSGLHPNFTMAYTWRFCLFSSKCFSGCCQIKAFYEGEYEKINELSNFKCNHASHINKIRDAAFELGSRGSFRTWNFALSNNGSLLYSSTSSFLSPSKCLRLRLVLKKYKESSHIYGKPFRFIFLPNVMYEYLKLDLDFWNFLSLFHCKLNETFSVQPFNHSSGSRIQVLSLLN